MLPEIRTLLPHTNKMVLLDRVIAVETDTLSAEVIITAESLFYDKAVNGVGAWVGIEYMAQAIAAWAGYKRLLQGGSVKIGFLVGTRRYETSRSFFAEGSILQIHVRCLLQANNGLASFECTIDEAQLPIASATLNVFQPNDLGEFLQPYA